MILLTQLASASAQTATFDFFIRLSVAPGIVDKADSYSTFFVYITDDRGSPVITPRDLEINLISSDSLVASVPDSITIPRGEYYTLGKIEIGDVGTTDIKASYEGQRVSAEIKVVKMSEAAGELTLSVRTPATSMLTATSMPISIFLSDSEGNAARAPFDIALNASYDQNLIKLDLPSKINSGSAYAIGTVTSLQRAGNAWIRLNADEIGQHIISSVKVVADKPKSLMLKALPGNITAFDRSFYLYAGLLDEGGIPALAGEDVTVRVYSNMTTTLVREEMLKGPITLSVKKGSFGSFMIIPLEVRDPNARSIFSFSAAAEGLQPTQTYLNLTSVKTRFSNVDNVKPFLETVPKAGENSQLIGVIQLRDINGTLVSVTSSAAQPEAISSNIDALEVTKVGFFGSGHTYALINLKTGFKSDNVMLVGGVPGFGSTNATINVVTKQPSKTVIFSPVNEIRFNNDNKSDLYVVLLDDSDRVVKAEKNMQFLLTPINGIQNIASGQSYTHFDFTKKQLTQTGNVTIVNLPVGVDSDLDLESNLELDVKADSAATVQLVPAFSDIIGLKSTQNMMIAQLVDGIGNPYRAPSDVPVKLTSSDPDIVNVDAEVKIPKDSSYTIFPIYASSSEGTAKITASAGNFESSSVTMRSILATLPLSITPSLPSPETNRELVLTVNSEPGAKLSWKLPANAKVVQMDEQVAADGTAELVLIPFSAEDIKVDLQGSKAGYVTNKVAYTSGVSSVVQNLQVQFISYSDTLLSGKTSTIAVKVTDDRGAPVEGVQLQWNIVNAEILSMSSSTDAGGSGSADIMTEGKKDVQVSVTATKSGFTEASKNTSLAIDVGSIQKQEDHDDILQGIPTSYLYIGLVGGVVAVASMRFMAMRKSGFKIPFRQSHQKNDSDSKSN